jgi:hypothetical protein
MVECDLTQSRCTGSNSGKPLVLLCFFFPDGPLSATRLLCSTWARPTRPISECVVYLHAPDMGRVRAGRAVETSTDCADEHPGRFQATHNFDFLIFVLFYFSRALTHLITPLSLSLSLSWQVAVFGGSFDTAHDVLGLLLLYDPSNNTWHLPAPGRGEGQVSGSPPSPRCPFIFVAINTILFLA